MTTNTRYRTALLGASLVLAISITACGRDEPAAPVGQMQAETPVQITHHPTTVTGCLRAGEAPNTFVLTTSRSETDETGTATYQLIGAHDANLLDHVGHRVTVGGVLRSQQDVATTVPRRPAGEEAKEEPRGTTGTPAVATQVDLALRQLEVQSVTPLNERCAE